MKICKFCGTDAEMVISDIHNLYYKCPHCGTHVIIEEIAFDYSSYFTIYDHDRIISILSADQGHYSGFTPKISALLEKEFDTIWSLGGGLPKLESFFKYKEMRVFDANAQQYYALIEEFRQRFPCEPDKMKFEQTFITMDTIKDLPIGRSDVVSFVHFLEHFSENEIIDFIDAVAISGGNLMIYQPEISSARNTGWYHFVTDQHKTFVPVETLKIFVENRGFKVVEAIKHSDDFFLYAENQTG